MMQIVIEIPEEVYKAYKLDFSLSFLNSDQQSFARGHLINGLLNGIPLPKGHGRLIDANALIDSLDASDRDIYCKAVIEEDAPTIIEEDKGYKQ